MINRHFATALFLFARLAISRQLFAALAVICTGVHPLHAAPSKKDKEPAIEPSVGYDATLDIHRGDTKTITLRAIPSDGYDVEFQILTQPRYGTLSKIVRNSKGSVALLYSHQDNKDSKADSFKFKIKTGPRKCWSTKTARIQISEPPPLLDFTPGTLDFGSVFIGESSTLPVKITNSGGGVLRGTLIPLSDSYSIIDSNEFDIHSGGSKTFAVTFAPKTPDTQPGKIRFESDVIPRAEISTQGIGNTRFEALEEAAFNPTIEPFSLSIEIANKTAEPLPISIHATPPLETSDKLELPPNGTSKLELKIKPGFFTGKFASLLLNDGAGEQSVKIQLPPPPAVLDWEAPNLDLGDVITGTSERLKVTLHNRGTSPAKVKLLSDGDGISIPEPEVSITPEQSLDIKAYWTFTALGPATATIRIGSGANLPPLTFRANVQEPRVQPSNSKSSPHSTPPISTKPTLNKPVNFPNKAEDLEIKKSTASITIKSCRLEQRFGSARAIVSWQFDDPQPTPYTIRVNPLSSSDYPEGFIEYFKKSLSEYLESRSTRFKDRVQVADEPSEPEKPTYQKVPDTITNIHQLPDGRWEGLTPGFKQGSHRIEIWGGAPESQWIEYEFTVPPLAQFWSKEWFDWLMGDEIIILENIPPPAPAAPDSEAPNRANAQEPRVETSPPQIPLPTSPPIATKAAIDMPVDFPNKLEDAARKQLTPSIISYRLEQRFSKARAIVSWKYNGPSTAKFSIHFQKPQRSVALSEGSQDRLPLPDKLPETNKLVWQPLPDTIANIHQLHDGTWEGTTHYLEPGFHLYGVQALTPGNKIAYGSESIVQVPQLPSPWMSKWLLGSVFLVCAGYLFRHPMLRLLGFSR